MERGLARPHGQHAAGSQARSCHERQHLAHGAGHAAQRGDAGGARHGIRLRDRRTSPSSASRIFWATAWCGRARRAASSTISSRKSRASPAATSWFMSSMASAASSGCRRWKSPARRMIVWNLHYAADTKLFLPVENIELLSRYGSDHANVELDRLGGSGWQARKAKLKNRIREIAGELIKIAAERHLHEAPKLPVQPHVYDEFCARFPLRGNRRSARRDPGDPEGSRKRPADGPADLRRRRLRQDRGGAARGVRGRARRQAGRRRGADDAAGAAAHQEFRGTFPGISGQRRAGLAPDPDRRN